MFPFPLSPRLSSLIPMGLDELLVDVMVETGADAWLDGGDMFRSAEDGVDSGVYA